MIYPKYHKFGDRELRIWNALLRAAGIHLITPFDSAESKYQF
ncbi:16748_t:CDS:2 [Funneliformis caledonium]|uniref:16748_t:CDS:1 n=1 Tax=Funneliformis caledonium TaxID=1117310 RepID=A0A9N9GZG3_9GLOM|nr:16748_t:CDS:2 [Funneliformis caledonium]